MNDTKPSHGALKAARLLRMKIHSMRPGDRIDEAGHPANSKWLDDVTIDDAKIIDQETGLKDIKIALATKNLEIGSLENMIRALIEALEIAVECGEMGNPAGDEVKIFIAALAKAKAKEVKTHGYSGIRCIG